MMTAPSGPSLKAVVFDKDGVLADSEAINLRSAFEVFRAHGYELVPEDEPTIVGRHPVTYVPLLARRFGMSEEEQRRVIGEQDAVYTRVWEQEGRLFDGAREALDAVRRRGLRVGMATSSSRLEVETFLDRFALVDAFDVTLSLDDVKRAKPDPEIYVLAAERLRVRASEMLVVEDSVHGIRSAKGAGAFCVAVRTRLVRPEPTDMADANIASLDELTPLLDAWR